MAAAAPLTRNERWMGRWACLTLAAASAAILSLSLTFRSGTLPQDPSCLGKHQQKGWSGEVSNKTLDSDGPSPPVDRTFSTKQQRKWDSEVRSKKTLDLHGHASPVEGWLLDDNDPTSSNEDINSDHRVIPRSINKVFLQKTGGFANGMNSAPGGPLRKALSSWKERNPGYEIRYFDLQSCRTYLSDHYHPVFLRAFDCLQSFAIKADFFRYAVVYRDGGWYSDWKQVCLADGLLDRLSSNGTEWAGGWDEGNDVVRENACVHNSFFGARPRHPALAAVLSLILGNIQSENYDGGPIHPTGPCALGAAWKRVGLTKDDGAASFGRFGSGRDGKYFFANVGGLNRKGGVIQTKCTGCGSGQGWDTGNNYNTLFGQRRYYCEDAKSLLGTSPDDTAAGLFNDTEAGQDSTRTAPGEEEKSGVTQSQDMNVVVGVFNGTTAHLVVKGGAGLKTRLITDKKDTGGESK